MVITDEEGFGLDIWLNSPNQDTGTKDIFLTIRSKEVIK